MDGINVDQYVVQLDEHIRTWLRTTPKGKQCTKSIWATAVALGRKLEPDDVRPLLTLYGYRKTDNTVRGERRGQHTAANPVFGTTTICG